MELIIEIFCYLILSVLIIGAVIGIVALRIVYFKNNLDLMELKDKELREKENEKDLLE